MRGWGGESNSGLLAYRSRVKSDSRFRYNDEDFGRDCAPDFGLRDASLRESVREAGVVLGSGLKIFWGRYENGLRGPNSRFAFAIRV